MWDVSSISFDMLPLQELALGLLSGLALVWVVKRVVGFLGDRRFEKWKVENDMDHL